VNADFSLPGALAIDSDRNLYVADYFGNRVFRIDPVQAKVSVVAGNGGKASSGDGGPAVEAGIPYPSAIALDHEKNLYIVQNGGGKVRKVDAKTGVISTIAGTGKLGFSGDGGPAQNADMNPAGIAVDQEGNLYVADT
jgi:DNA-binding beta-propeller fold protein YncE